MISTTTTTTTNTSSSELVAAIDNIKLLDFASGPLRARLYLPGIKHKDLVLGYIGNLSASSHCTAEERIAFLVAAKDRLFALGAQKVIGPINGDTWHRYRLPLTDESQLTFLEPSYPHFIASDFMAAGLSVTATYHSSVIEDLRGALLQAKKQPAVEVASDLKIRNLDLSDFDNEMELLHRFSHDAFKTNYLYSDIDLPSFNALYQPLKGMLKEDLVLIAESSDSKEIFGVVLAVPDAKNKSMIIVKTLARSTFAPRGTGRFLFHTVLERAQALGYNSALCALIKDNNFSAFLPEALGGIVQNKFALFACTKE